MSQNTRDAIRAAIFAGTNMKPKSKVIDFFGQSIEIKQLNLDTVLSMRTNDENADTKSRMVQMVVLYAFVPGTEERVFEDTDRDTLLQLPFGPDFQRLQNTITELTNVNLATEDAEKNLTGTDSPTK